MGREDTSRVVAVVQARNGSERLPEKVLARLGDKPVIAHVLAALEAATTVDEVVLATTEAPVDDRLADVARELGFRVHRGSEEDVLGRFVDAVEGDPADVVLRQTGDNPLLDPGIVDTAVAEYLKGGCDYVSNNVERTWPRGMDVEVVSREALERSHREGQRPEDREHVTVYIRTHPELFRIRQVHAPARETWPDLRLTLDTPADFELLTRVFGELYEPGRIIHAGAVIDWFRAHPDVAAINAGIEQKTVLGRSF
jgi:spore coat polysaccharide biosynthesis protein SpsF